MTPKRWVLTAATGALTGLISVAALPIVGYTTTTGLWLTYLTIASGLITMATTVIAMVALSPLQPPTAPQERYEPLPPVVTARVIRPALERPVLALPAGEPQRNRWPAYDGHPGVFSSRGPTLGPALPAGDGS